MRRYALSLEAEQDLRDIRAYYQKRADARVSRYVLGEITKALRLLAANPGIGHLRSDLTAEPMKFWPVFSYLVIYDPARQPLGIARVAHASQDLAAMFRKKPPLV